MINPIDQTLSARILKIKARNFCLLLLMFITISASSQEGVKDDLSLEIFSASSMRAADDLSDKISQGTFLTVNPDVLLDLRNEAPEQFILKIPLHSRSVLIADLHQVDIFSPVFQLSVSDGLDYSDVDLGVHYRGSIEGAEHSIVAISVFANEIKGILVTGNENYNLGPLERGGTEYICYRSADLTEEVKSQFSFNCEMVESETGVYSTEQLEFAQRDPGDPTSIYIEVDKSLYDAEGGDIGLTTSYVGALFNESAAIFAAESVLLDLSEIFIWSSPDPYDGVNIDPDIRGAYLEDFQDEFDGFNGDLAILLVGLDIGGKAAGFAGLCNPDPDLSMCVGGRSGPDIEPFPTYSYNVYNFSHELGHLFGSRHTHACVWNGDDTAIDGCSGATEGGCPLPPDPASGEATIMSYCQDELAGGFVVLAPFGPQPGAVIRASVASATCLGCPTEELIYLPDVLGAGPALVLCDSEPVPPGYTEALSQFCAFTVLETEPFCGDITWDAGCLASYEGCWVPGCMDPTACNYDPVSNIEDGSCDYGLWYLPVDFTLSETEPAVLACSLPAGYMLADQACIIPIVETDPFCWESDWDSVCQDQYIVCLPDTCTAFVTAPVDLTKSFDPVGGVQDRLQVKWFKGVPELRYTDDDAAMCDIKFWKKRDLDPTTGDPIGPAYVSPDTTLIADAKKTFGDSSPREIFKWPIKFRADAANNTKRAEPNLRYEWKVRCECGHSGDGPESPWSAVKIFNTPDFDPFTGIYEPPEGMADDAVSKSLESSLLHMEIFPNPNDGSTLSLATERELEPDAYMSIHDVMGTLVYSRALRSSKDEIRHIDLDGALSPGLYLVSIIQSGSRLTTTLIIK